MTDQTTQPETPSSQVSNALAWTGLTLCIAGTLFRAMVSLDPFPHWDVNPFIVGSIPTGLGPTAVLALDCLAIVGLACVLAGEAVARRRVDALTIGLWLIGSIGVMVHGLTDSGDMLLGASWIAALAAGVAGLHLGRSSRIGRVGLAIVIGFVMMLAARGAVQVFIEHPATVAHYDANRDSFLAAKGWAADSASALAYERRLNQAEASGWFGLANVYASFMAMGVVALAGLAWAGCRDRRPTLVLLAGLVFAAGGLWLSGSKGGAGAVMVGLTVLVAAAWAARLPRMLVRIAVAAPPLAVLALIVGRGMVGERIGELSLLFRWFYIETAGRIFGSHPLLGVGPDGFKDAYTLAKPAISPEEVTSPHSVFFDWAATLGVFGVAWGVMLCAWAWRLGRPATHEIAPESTPSMRVDLRIVFLLAAAATLGSVWIEAAMATPESVVMRLLGLIGWLGVAWAVLSATMSDSRRVWAVCAAMAMTLLAHAQIEMTPVNQSSAALLFLVVGLCMPRRDSATRCGCRSRWIWPAIALLPVGFLLATSMPGTARWEAALTDAARSADRVPPVTDRSSLGLRMLAHERAIASLEAALVARPDHQPTRQETSALMLDLAAMVYASGQPARALTLSEQAEQIASAIPSRQQHRAAAWQWLGLVQRGRAGFEDEPGPALLHLERSMVSLTRAAELAPHNLPLAVRLMGTAEQLADAPAARVWARRALQIDANLRLDPLKQLSPEDRLRCERLADGP